MRNTFEIELTEETISGSRLTITAEINYRRGFDVTWNVSDVVAAVFYLAGGDGPAHVLDVDAAKPAWVRFADRLATQFAATIERAIDRRAELDAELMAETAAEMRR